jgi:hypothetical protein
MWHAWMNHWHATSAVWWWHGLWGTTTVAIVVIVGVGIIGGRGISVGGQWSVRVVGGCCVWWWWEEKSYALLVKPNRVSGFANILSGKAVRGSVWKLG